MKLFWSYLWCFKASESSSKCPMTRVPIWNSSPPALAKTNRQTWSHRLGLGQWRTKARWYAEEILLFLLLTTLLLLKFFFPTQLLPHPPPLIWHIRKTWPSVLKINSMWQFKEIVAYVTLKSFWGEKKIYKNQKLERLFFQHFSVKQCSLWLVDRNI